MDSDDVARHLDRAYGQPSGQNIPADFLKMLADLDRSHRATRTIDPRSIKRS